MNKSTMIAAIFAASAFSAFAADVYSSNIVGYTKLDLNLDYNMFGAQFQEVGMDSIDIQDLLVNTSLPDPEVVGENVFWGAKLLTWTGSGYATYYWSGTTGEELFGNAAWDNKWLVDEGAAIATGVDVLPGDGLFIQVNALSSVTLAGEVVTNSQVQVALNEDYTLIANPFPISIDIQNLVVSNFPNPEVVGENVLWGAKLLTWTGSGYATYYWSGTTGEELFGNAAWDNKWLVDEGAAIASGATLEVGDGVFIWLKAGTSNASITFSK